MQITPVQPAAGGEKITKGIANFFSLAKPGAPVINPKSVLDKLNMSVLTPSDGNSTDMVDATPEDGEKASAVQKKKRKSSPKKGKKEDAKDISSCADDTSAKSSGSIAVFTTGMYTLMHTFFPFAQTFLSNTFLLSRFS
jgi:hypothetical protein